MGKTKWNKNLIGTKFGYLTILGLSDKRGKNLGVRIYCQCACGKIINPLLVSIYSHNHRSCGCRSKHNMCGKNFYNSWRNMKERCLKKYSSNYKYYGGRGIKINKDWIEFLNFKKDMYFKYIFCKIKYNTEKLTIERVDCNKDYCKENCTFIPKSDQNKNKRKNPNKAIKATNIKTKEVIIGENQMEISKMLCVSKGFFSRIINGERTLGDWKFERLTKERRIK